MERVSSAHVRSELRYNARYMFIARMGALNLVQQCWFIQLFDKVTGFSVKLVEISAKRDIKVFYSLPIKKNFTIEFMIEFS